MTACAGPDGIVIGSTWEGTALSGERGQSYTGHRGVSRSDRDGVAVAGVEGRATATHVVVAEDAEAEVLDGPAPMFAADEGSRVHARETGGAASCEHRRLHREVASRGHAWGA